jgi:putative DNA primase/helicase
MNIQILGLRDYIDPKDKKTKKTERFFDRNWRAPSVPELLADPDKYLANIPLEERYNLYFTTAECVEEKGRKLLTQKVIPFDIDGIDTTKVRETWFAACEALGLIPERNGATFSGNGIWIFTNSSIYISEESYFETHRIYYKELCHKINTKLKAKGLAGKADPSVWSPARLARMPNTLNIKKDRENAKAYTLNAVMDGQIDLIALSGVPLLTKEDQLDKNFMRGYPSPDAVEILSERGCGFLASCKETPNDLTEEQWYAMLGILDWLPNGRHYSHEYSRGYTGYSFEETERKAEQAKQNAGPRTCKNINQIWSKCGTCPHFNKITSPIQLRGKDFVITEKTGFWSYKQNKEGIVTPHKPEVMDLVKFFKRNHTFVSVPETQELFLYNGKHWEEKHTSYLQIYAKDNFTPSVPTHIYDEFKKNVLLTNVVQREWFFKSTNGMFNLQNGVFDMHKDLLIPHSPDFGFVTILPYNYDKDARCPLFDKFMEEVTLGRSDLTTLLLEFAGYSLSNDDNWLQKAMFLNGGGANGKSTYADVIRALAGSDNVSAQRLERLGNPVVNALLENKLLNISEETGAAALFDGQDFKELVSGGHINIKKLYKNQYEVVNRTKFMLLCNELPMASDGSHGFFRRLVIVPFDAVFNEASRDPHILAKLSTELSGVFNLVLHHYKDLKARGTLTMASTASAAVNKYMVQADVASAWIRDNFELLDTATADKWVTSTDVYQEYSHNCQYEWGIKAVSATRFWIKAEHVFKDLEFHSRRKNMRKNGKQVWIIKGLIKKEEVNGEF